MNQTTSVHYVIASGSRKIKTCEIQVRTLLEEVWGEIDHSINYPHRIDSIACQRQLETLAHAIMGATANVDGIVQTVAALKQERQTDLQAAVAPKAKKPRSRK
jgi:ppGpp synthetase/RelA/SpoT-type nucleotidyltranferase